jgi:hypothetical protein
MTAQSSRNSTAGETADWGDSPATRASGSRGRFHDRVGLPFHAENAGLEAGEGGPAQLPCGYGEALSTEQVHSGATRDRNRDVGEIGVLGVNDRSYARTMKSA